jgi:hypothetical protein
VQENNMEHIYYEVGTSLLAKPQALCDLVEVEAGHTCLVCCNSPSDADFADVILKKRGVASLKLIGYVPQIKLSKALQQLENREVSVLVITDVAARGLPLGDFDVVINYSVPADPEVYFQRFIGEGDTKTKRVLSLVSAMDITNFHFLKKLGKVEFVQAEPPSAGEIFAGKFKQLRDQAVERAESGEPVLTEVIDKILSDDRSRDIISFLIHNTLSVIPALRAASAPQGEEAAEFEEDEFEDDSIQPDFDKLNEGGRRGRRGDGDRGDRRDRREGRDGRGGRGGRDRGDRRDRGERGARGDRDRSARDHGGNGGRGDRGRDRFRDEGGDRSVGFTRGDEGDDRGRGGRGRGGRDRRDRDDTRNYDRDDSGRGESRGGERRSRRGDRAPAFVNKEARLYVGAGTKHGVVADTLKGELADSCGLDPAEIHRVIVRGAYSFVDVADGIADQVVSKFGAGDNGGQGRYLVKRAVTLSIPREPTAEELASLEGGRGDYSEERGDAADRSDSASGGSERLGRRRRRRLRRGEQGEMTRADYSAEHDHEASDGAEGEGEGPTLLAVDE